MLMAENAILAHYSGVRGLAGITAQKSCLYFIVLRCEAAAQLAEDMAYMFWSC
jgi:hypothetical protein